VNLKKDWNKITKNEGGVAILMVLTAITILTAVMGDFTFETQINKIKSINMQDKAQARMAAEAGIKLALVRLRLYKEAFNYIEKNKAAKENVQMEVVNQLWAVPFAYPIPSSAAMSAKQRGAIEKFMKNSLLEGQLMVSISNMSNRINLNLLRVSLFQQKKKETQQAEGADFYQGEEGSGTTYNEIVKLITNVVRRRSEQDERFDDRYSSIIVEELVSSIKYYISDPDSEYDDGFRGAVEGKYADEGVTPKFASMASVSELNLLAGWDDELVELFKGDITVHPNVMIDLNKITDKMLRLIVPDIDDEQVKAFFEYRDDPEDPHPFNGLNDFKAYIVNTAGVMNQTDFDERMKQFEKADIKFGSAPSLFKISSVGKYGRSIYTLEAYVSMPVRPKVEVPPPPPPPAPQPGQPAPQQPKVVEQPTQLLEPRIVEIIVK
jgi:type II secretory pathway component PulK